MKAIKRLAALKARMDARAKYFAVDPFDWLDAHRRVFASAPFGCSRVWPRWI